jgi:hypothetical protein
MLPVPVPSIVHTRQWAKGLGFRLLRRMHWSNPAQFQLVDSTNTVVLGVNFSATLNDVNSYLLQVSAQRRMTGNGGWNPMPNNYARTTPAQKPRVPAEELWRLTRGGQVATCELLDDSREGAGWEVRVRHDGELLIGRRCLNEAEARYYGETFRQDYARSGWRETA